MESRSRKGSVVTLSPFAVIQPVRCVVPKLHRFSLRQARAALSHAHCAVGVVHVPPRVARGHERSTPIPP